MEIVKDGQFQTEWVSYVCGNLATAGLELSIILRETDDDYKNVCMDLKGATKIITTAQEYIFSVIDASIPISEALDGHNAMEAFINSKGLAKEFEDYYYSVYQPKQSKKIILNPFLH